MFPIRLALSIALLISFLLGSLPSSAAMGDAPLAKPPGLDDAGWFSLQQAVRESITQPTKLTGEGSTKSAEGAAYDKFGGSVAVYGDTALVGTPNDAVGGNIQQGSAYILSRNGDVWNMQAKLVADDGAAIEFFGRSVALHGDTALVGALANVNNNSGRGAVYVFTREGGTWTQQAKVIASDGAADHGFGGSVALYGETALVSNNRNSAYVFTRSESLWIQQAKLMADDGSGSDQFGYSVALSGDTALVGARLADIGAATDQGAAYVFKRTGSTWSQEAKLVSHDGAAHHLFGESVALAGDTALVGARGEHLGNGRYEGAAYVFTRGGSAWTRQAKLMADDASRSTHFGFSVALSGDSALVGAHTTDIGANRTQGAAHVFTRTGTLWTRQALLIAEDGAYGDELGAAVALHGDTALAGALGADIEINLNQGAAYVFGRTGTSWSQQSKLHTGIGSTNDEFGFSVSVSGDTALVGARLDDVGNNIDQGSAYVFKRSGSAWRLQAKLIADDGSAGDRFGHAVALAGHTAVVGAYLDGQGSPESQEGSAYVFIRNGSTWTQQAKLVASDGAVFDWFGFSVAIFGDTVLVGARYDDVGANFNQGSAYVFTRSESTWTQQAKLVAVDGAEYDSFGTSVALFGDTALVGAVNHGVGGYPRQGAAYVFTRTGSFWSSQAKLVAADGGYQDFFGTSVALSNDTALVGAQLDLLNAGQERGAAYVFTRDGSFWTQQARLAPNDSAERDRFGNSVALSGDIALVGSALSDVGANADQGSAYVFGRSGNTWTQLAKLVVEGGAAGDRFGVAVALSGRTAIIGANGVDGPAPYGNPDEGAAYVGVLGDLFQDGFEAAEEPARQAAWKLE